MTSLAVLQQAMLDALFEWPAGEAMRRMSALTKDRASRGIKVYQSNGHALAERALQAAYPVMHQLVGSESFADLARALWHAHPPVHGDVALWGEALGRFVDGNVQLADEPYLSEVACVEWAMHLAATAGNAFAEPESLALLTSEDPADVTLRLSPGVFIKSCTWPVAGIVNAHLMGEPSFAEIGRQLQDRVAQAVVVWRNGLRPCVREALPQELAVVAALQEGCSLASALERAGTLDFAVWFPMALQTGLILGVDRIST